MTSASESDLKTGRAVGVQGLGIRTQLVKKVRRLRITKPGVYENYLVDGQWARTNLVKINSDNVILRQCEIRNGAHNAVAVYAKNVVIDSCKIHHLLRGSYEQQDDAHGITGCPSNLTIRNCEIFYVSGDCVQFCPERQPWDNVLIENCTFWTGPLPTDAAGFKQGERPGENAFDSKNLARNPPSQVTIRNCLMFGWQQPGQIPLMAALNVKENVQVTIERCVFRDNEVCFRLRGDPGGDRGGATVSIRDCAVYESKVAVRMEDQIRNLKVSRLGIGRGIDRVYHMVGRGPWPGFESNNEYKAPPYEELLRREFATEDTAGRND